MSGHWAAAAAGHVEPGETTTSLPAPPPCGWAAVAIASRACLTGGMSTQPTDPAVEPSSPDDPIPPIPTKPVDPGNPDNPGPPGEPDPVHPASAPTPPTPRRGEGSPTRLAA
jgi:hypothetical protein